MFNFKKRQIQHENFRIFRHELSKGDQKSSESIDIMLLLKILSIERNNNVIVIFFKSKQGKSNTDSSTANRKAY